MLHCHWDPLIPFANARFRQRIDVRLAESARLYGSDAFMCGRALAPRQQTSAWFRAAADDQVQAVRDARSTLGALPACGSVDANAGTEQWAFASLAHEFLVTRGETLEYLERYRLVPEEGRVAHRWVGGDACYFGTTLMSRSTVDAAKVERLHEDLAGIDGVRAAADAIERELFVARLMSRTGPPFHDARKHLCCRLAAALNHAEVCWATWRSSRS